MLNTGLALTVMATVDVEFAHGAFAIDHWNTYVPAVVKPVMVVVAEPGVVIVPVTGPEICDHVPVPTAGVLPAIVTLPTLVQIVCGGPALAVVGAGFTVIVTLDVEGVHGALAIDHWNTYAPAVVKPFMVVVGEPGVTIVPVTGPEICDHVPVPVVGVLPAMITDPVVAQIVCGGPELAILGAGLTVMVTVDVEVAQGALAIDHWNT
jgi:hypothetical protein